MVPADLQKPLTQAEFGELVGVSQQTVSGLVSAGVLASGATGHEWLVAYCGRLREQAAGRAAQGGLDLATERAALARAQREAVELKNAVARGQYAPITLLASVLAKASSAVAAQMDGIEGTLAKLAPDLPERTKQGVLGAVAKARNEWVRTTSSLVDSQLEEIAALDDDDGDQLEAVEP